MSTNTIKNPNHMARLAGFLYLSLIPLGYFGMMYVSAILIVPDDIAATIDNIIASESLYRLSVASALMMNIVSILLALALYKLLMPVNKDVATLMVVLLLPGAIIAMLNEVNHFAALVFSLESATSPFSVEQSQYFVNLFLDMYEFGAYIASIFWGLWLLPLGYLIIKSYFIPKILGILLYLASFAYVADSFMLFIAPQVGLSLVDYLFIGELTITFWLVIKGVNVEQWHKVNQDFQANRAATVF